MKNPLGYLFIFFALMVFAACGNKKALEDKVDLAPAEMRAVIEQKAEKDAERVEIDSVAGGDRIVRIVFYNSLVGNRDANEAATKLVTDILHYSDFHPQFAGYQINYEFKIAWFFGLVKRSFSNEIFINKQQIQKMIEELNRPELILPAAIEKNLKKGNYQEVITLSDSLLGMEVRGAGVADIHLQRAYAFLGFKDTIKAIKEYDRVMQFADTLPRAWPILAELYKKVNETPKEKHCWLKALEFDSANGEICYNLAQIAYKENRQKDYCKLLHKAAKLNYAFPQSELLMCE